MGSSIPRRRRHKGYRRQQENRHHPRRRASLHAAGATASPLIPEKACSAGIRRHCSCLSPAHASWRDTSLRGLTRGSAAEQRLLQESLPTGTSSTVPVPVGAPRGTRPPDEGQEMTRCRLGSDHEEAGAIAPRGKDGRKTQRTRAEVCFPGAVQAPAGCYGGLVEITVD